MKHGGRRKGAGRPKQRTVLEVALSLSAPAEWEATPPVYRESEESQVSARYRPSAASATRSSIPAAAVRRQEIEVNAGRARRSISEIEWELVERHDASSNGPKAAVFEQLSEEVQEGFAEGYLDSVLVPSTYINSGSSMSDFLTERFYDGTMQPTELRGIRRVE